MDLLEYLSNRLTTASTVWERRALRIDLFKALINSYPEGTIIPSAELSKLLQFNKTNRNSIHDMKYQLKLSGDIAYESRGRLGSIYTILKPVNTYDEERAEASKAPVIRRKDGQVQEMEKASVAAPAEVEEDKPNVENHESRPDAFVIHNHGYTFRRLETLAMRFKFYHPEGTLQEFLQTLKEGD